MRTALILLLVLGTWNGLAAQEVPPPILDVHLHASPANAQGPPPLGLCAPGHELPVWDPTDSYSDAFLNWMKEPPCEAPLWSPETDTDLLEQTLEVLERRNVYGVTSGAAPILARWQEAGGSRIIPGLWFGRTLRSFPDDCWNQATTNSSAKWRFNTMGSHLATPSLLPISR